MKQIIIKLVVHVTFLYDNIDYDAAQSLCTAKFQDGKLFGLNKFSHGDSRLRVHTHLYLHLCTIMCTLSAKCCLGLKTRVIIKILTDPCYPINVDSIE